MCEMGTFSFLFYTQTCEELYELVYVESQGPCLHRGGPQTGLLPLGGS